MDLSNQLFEPLLFMFAAILLVPLFRRLGLGNVLGYLCAGFLLSPGVSGLIADTAAVAHLAELGVVMLMFAIGLELEPRKLWSMRQKIFVAGFLQMATTTLAIGAVALFLGLAPTAALVIGFCLSLSSTAFGVQIMRENNLLKTQVGSRAFGILLFQDLATIPALVAVPLLLASSSAPIDPIPVVIALGALLAVIVGSRVFTRPLFRLAAAAGSREIYTALTLAIVLGMAFLMQKVGLSMALGAFLAGALMAATEYRHSLEADIEPFKGLLMGLFFMSVGLSIDIQTLAGEAPTIVALTLGLMAVKVAALVMCGAIFRLPLMDSLKKAVLLAQAGEFGFVLLGLPAVAGALPAATLQILVAVISLSLVFSPLLFRAFIAVYSRHANKDLKAHDEIVNDHPAVIIAGIGRVGQIVARVLRLQKIHFSCLEHDHAQVQVARRFGIPTYLGDASRLDLLEAAGARHARVFVLAIQNLESSLAAARVVRAHFPHLKIVARVRNRAHAFELMDLGVEEFVRETFAGSLELADLVLRHHGVGEESRRRTESRFRFHDAKLLMDQYKIRKDPDKLIRYTNEFTQQLISVFEEDEKRDTSGQSTHSS